MHILFIGGTGNISSDCAALLFGKGHAISVLSRGQSSVPSEYARLVADRHDLSAMRAALGTSRPDVVVNFLGYELSDVQTDFELFAGKISQDAFISSATVYEKPPQRLPITEETPLGNVYWEYARKKLACERWLLDQFEKSEFPVTVVRPSHTYSRRWIPNPVSSSSYSFAARLEGGKPVYVPDDGESLWTLTTASDFAAGFGGLVGNKAAVGQAFHITSDEVLTWNQIIEEIGAALGVNSPQIVKVPTDFICQVAPQLTGTLKGDKSHPGVFDNSKLKRFVPGFECRKPFRTGVRESVAWLRLHPEQQNRKTEVDTLCDSIISAWRAQAGHECG